jgi:hypothetical protein
MLLAPGETVYLLDGEVDFTKAGVTGVGLSQEGAITDWSVKFVEMIAIPKVKGKRRKVVMLPP